MGRSRIHEDAFFARLKREAGKRSSTIDDIARADALASLRFPAQQAVADDPARWVSVRVPRRGGKSFTALSIAMERCLRNPGSSWVVIGLSRPTIKRIYWQPVKKMAGALDLELSYAIVEMVVTFPNGSAITFVGAENLAEVEKLRGPSYHGVIVDECKSFNPVVFETLIQDVLEPATDDHQGQIILIGTPGHILAGPFYLSTAMKPIMMEDERGAKTIRSNRLWEERVPDEDPHSFVWSLHTWTRQANDRVRDKDGVPTLWRDALDKKRRNGWKDDNPRWRREYLGEWVAENDLQVYRYRPYAHDWEPGDPEEPVAALPAGHAWRLVAGVDLGYDDPFAYVLWAYSQTHPGLYEIYSTAKPGLNVTQMAGEIRRIELMFGRPERRVADRGGLGKLLLAELASEHGVYCEPAEKAEKNDHIELFNTDLDNGLIHPRRGSVLATQLLGNQWLEKTLGTINRREDPKTPNDATDAGLYGYRYCYHRRAKDPGREPERRSAAWFEAEEKRAIAKLEAEALKRMGRRPANSDWWETN